MLNENKLAEYAYAPSLYRPLSADSSDIAYAGNKGKATEEEYFHLAQGGLIKGLAAAAILFGLPLITRAMLAIRLERDLSIGLLAAMFIFVLVAVFAINTYATGRLRKGVKVEFPVLAQISHKVKKNKIFAELAMISPWVIFFIWLVVILVNNGFLT